MPCQSLGQRPSQRPERKPAVAPTKRWKHPHLGVTRCLDCSVAFSCATHAGSTPLILFIRSRPRLLLALYARLPTPPVCQTASTIPTTGKQQQRLLFRWIRTATRGSQVTATSLRCQRRRLCGAVGARAPCTALSRSPPARAAIADILTCCVPPVTMGTWRQPWAPGLRNRLRCFASAEPSSVAETRAGWRGLCPGRLAAVWRRTRMPKGGPTRIARRSSRR